MIDYKEYVKSHFKLNGPSHRGATMPSFNPSKVNEANFNDGRRPKEVSWAWENGVFYVEWVSQEYGELDSFFKELQRWKDYIVSRALEDEEIDLGDIDGWDFPMIVTVSCRDDYDDDDAIVRDIDCSFNI